MKIRLDWKSLFPSSHGQFSICQDSDERVECLKGQYAEIFKPELGTVKGVPAKLHLKENATPVFQRARLVPYVLRPTVEEELKRLENKGVLKPVEVSDWATPIVWVLKTDGSVRICGGYKGKVNPAILTKQFPVATLEEDKDVYRPGRNLRRWICEARISNWYWTRRHKNFVLLTPIRVYSNIHACHGEFHLALQFGNDSLSKFTQAWRNMCHYGRSVSERL